jgi:hypothetical protein
MEERENWVIKMKTSNIKHSLSAPKMMASRSSSLFDFSQPTLSPGVSPSVTVVENIPLEQNVHSKKQNIFFNDTIPIQQLRMLGDINTIEEEEDSPSNLNHNWEINRKHFDRWLSKSASFNYSDPRDFHNSLADHTIQHIADPLPLEHTPPPPGFVSKSPLPVKADQAKSQKRRWADISSDSDFTPLTGKTPGLDSIKENETKVHFSIPTTVVKLQNPPVPKKKSIEKRENRGHFVREEVIEDRHKGTLKFYQLKRRFGFIKLEDESDVFLCEDDLILSGINHKKFKENVMNKVPVEFTFKIKAYEENGKPKRKAIDIEII